MPHKQQVVSITSQGQLTIPKSIRKNFGIKQAVKAVIWEQAGKIVVEPKTDFWSLAGSLKSKVRLSEQQMKKARQAFASRWASHA